MAWTVDFGALGLTELEKQINKVERAEKKTLTKARKKQLRKKATQARKILEKENTVKEIVSKGMFKSSITGKLYRHKDEAYRAGERAKERARKPLYKDEASKQFYNEELKKRQEAAEKRAEIRRIEEDNKRYEQHLDEMDEWEPVDEGEWEEVQNHADDKPQVTEDIYCYWDDVKHGLIGNPWYYLHTSGSWLYVNGYDDWNLTKLMDNPYWTSEDGHTNRDFVEQALKDSPLGMQYEVVEDDNGNPYIARK